MLYSKNPLRTSLPSHDASPTPGAPGLFRRIITVVLGIALLAAAGLTGGYLKLRQWAGRPFPVPPETVIEFKPGTSLATLSDALESQRVVSSGSMFHAWVRMFGEYRQFQAGRYRFGGDQTPQEICDKIIKGETYNPVVLQITVPEGFTMKAVVERLAANGVGHIVTLRRLVRDAQFLKKLGVPSTTLEGYLYPATYNFHDVPTPEAALEQMVKTFFQNLPKDYESRAQRLGLTLGDAVTFASLIELETRSDDEKPLIAEVIWNRLHDKMPLAIDASLIYGIPDYAGDLKWVHLSDAKNPYNTRIHQGLPPTPIGSPGVKALEAVLTPSHFGYYYYVLIPGEGRHHFSRTLKEHNFHVKKLLNSTKSDKDHAKDKKH